MSLQSVIEAASALRTTLEQEIQRAKEERAFLRAFDAAALLQRVQIRQSFQRELAHAESELATALAQAARILGLREASLAAFREAAPAEALRLAGELEQIRAAAETLTHVNALNRELAAKALECTSAYVRALSPRAATYDRRGAQLGSGADRSLSRRV